MRYIIFPVTALFAYFIASINPAITLSKLIYKKDIRNLGSGNPGFTNFKRSFGGKFAWLVFLLDVLKGAIISVIAGLLFGKYYGSWQLGVAFASFFGVIGHCFPVLYGFNGGKGFLVCFSSLFFIDPKTGIAAAAVLIILLLTTKYMSLSTLASLAAGLVCIILLGYPAAVCLLEASAVAIVFVRHRKNIKRLINREEPKFGFGHSGKAKEAKE